MDIDIVTVQGTILEQATRIITSDNIVTELKEGQTESYLVE